MGSSMRIFNEDLRQLNIVGIDAVALGSDKSSVPTLGSYCWGDKRRKTEQMDNWSLVRTRIVITNQP